MMKLLTMAVIVVYIISADKMSQVKAAPLNRLDWVAQFIVQLLVTIYQNIVEDNARSFHRLAVTMRSTEIRKIQLSQSRVTSGYPGALPEA